MKLCCLDLCEGLFECFKNKNKKSIVCLRFFSYFQLETLLNILVRVTVSLTGRVSDGCIKDPGFNPRLHQKLIGVLVW